MGYKDLCDRLALDRSLADRTGFNPYYCEIQSALDDPVVINGKEYINLASNNYLGLANDRRVKAAAVNAIEKYGASMCGTPVATGYIDLYRRVEEKLAEFLGLEAAIILPSCYQTNNGLFTAIADRDDIILVDRFAHSSLVQGIKAAGCKIRPFLHNNVEHLEEILGNSGGYSRVFVVTESVFSTDGSIAPLKEMVELCERFDAIPVVDDSHGIGVIGKSGRGILEDQGISDFKGIYTASLGKAFANSGGIISGHKCIIEYLRYYCPHLVYSTALPPSVLGGIEAVTGIIIKEFDTISRKMWSYKDSLYKALLEAGFEVVSGRAPINSIVAGSAENTFLTAKKLYDSRVMSTPFIEPSVPLNEGRVRLIAGANLSEETIKEAANIIKKAGRT